jgi:proline racemase
MRRKGSVASSGRLACWQGRRKGLGTGARPGAPKQRRTTAGGLGDALPSAAETELNGVRAVRPTVKGTAGFLGTARWVIDRDDPVAAGFLVF